MRWRLAAALGAAILGFAALLLFVTARQETVASNSPASGSPIRTSVQDVMQSIVDPSADALWNAVGAFLDKDQGLVEWSPKTEGEWSDLRHAAVRIIEGANLLMVPGREAAPADAKSVVPGVELEPAEITALINGNRTAFDTFAEALRTLGWEALRASDAKDSASLMDVGGRMQEVCESCHATFWYPNQHIPEFGKERSKP